MTNHEQTTFSVITVVLNAGKNLMDTVRTVLSQTCCDYELIIKDGLSDDGSIESLPKNDRIRIARRKDSGIFDAMNQAILLAKGKYVLFLNAGDLFYAPDVLERLLPFCEHEESPDLIYTDFAQHQRDLVRSPSRLTRFFLYRTMLCHQACFVRKECFDFLGSFDTRFPVAADFEFLMRLMLRPKASSVYVPIIATTFLGGGSSSRPENVRKGEKEVSIMRLRHFTTWERFIFSTVYSFTLPTVRMWLLRSKWLVFLRNPYRHLVNYCYFVCDKMRTFK